MKLFKKISLLFIALTFITFLWVTSNVKADSDIESYYNTCIDYLNNNNISYYNYMITSSGDSYFYYFTTDESNGSIIYAEDRSYHTYLIKNGVVFYFDSVNESNNRVPLNSYGNSYVDVGNADVFSIIYSNFNVINGQNDSIFFQQTPLPAPMEIQGVLANQVSSQEMGAVLQEVVSLLPLTIVVVVSLVGLRKGLMLLRQVLHKA